MISIPFPSLLGFAKYTNEDRRVDFQYPVSTGIHWIPVIGDDVFVRCVELGVSTESAARVSRLPPRRRPL